MKKRTLSYAVAAAFVLASAASNVAYAVYEVEPNHPITQAQPITIGSDGTAEITAAIGAVTPSSSPEPDLDFFSFEAFEGNVLNLDVDGGMKAAGSGTRSVDTIIAIFGPLPSLDMKARIDQALDIDSGSLSRSDARIDNWLVPTTGTYVVGVSSFPRDFRNGGVVVFPSSITGANANGSYTLRISGVKPLVQQINIAIKPGSDEWAPINPKSRGNIPVALLSSKDFDPRTVDYETLRFGRTGAEESYLRCGKDETDVNGDGLPDVVCHFENQKTEFKRTDTAGILKGKTRAGRQFEGRGMIKSVLPAERGDDD